MKCCEHKQFRADVRVDRLQAEEGGPITHYTAEVKVHCADCGLQFEFYGLPVGYSAYQATVDLGGTTLNVPMMPPGEHPPAGLTGFSVRPVED